LLAQKRGDKPAFVEPARALAKKGTLPNAAPRRLARPSLGKEANPLFLLAGATHCALILHCDS